MLEAMGEGQVTIEGETHKLEKPFVVLATANPVEQEGTYPLPEAQLDRFLIKVIIHHYLLMMNYELLNSKMNPFQQ